MIVIDILSKGVAVKDGMEGMYNSQVIIIDILSKGIAVKDGMGGLVGTAAVGNMHYAMAYTLHCRGWKFMSSSHVRGCVNLRSLLLIGCLLLCSQLGARLAHGLNY